MPRFSQPRSGDTPVTVNLDSLFTGLDSRRSADYGEGFPGPGQVIQAVNLRLPNGDAETRAGVLQPKHFNPAFASIQGAGVFSDPNGSEWLLIVTPTAVWMCSEYTNPVSIAIPAGETITQRVELVQTFSSMIMCRGKDAPILEWDGDRFHPWRSVVQTPPNPDSPSFLEPPPNSEWAIVMADRVFYPDGSDGLIWSDLLDYTRVDTILSSARFNNGEDDQIVYAAPYQGNRLVVFKSQSIYFLNGVGGDMSGASIDRLPLRVGCVARRTVQQVGGDLFWLAQGGVYRMTQTTQGEMRGIAIPVSEPIANEMNRINWTAAKNASATVTNDHYFLHVPIDGSSLCNATLVYNLQTGTWQSLDIYAAPPEEENTTPAPVEIGAWDPVHGHPTMISPEMDRPVPLQGRSMVTTDWLGLRSAFLIGERAVTVIGFGDVDRIGDQERPIYSSLKSRGYFLGALKTTSIRNVTTCLGTRNAEITTRIQTDGQAETLTVQNRKTRDRRKYFVHGRAPFNLSNAGDNFAAPFREDYTWKAGDGVQLKSGIPLGLSQQFDTAMPIRRLGRFFSINIASHKGRFKLSALQAEGLPDKNHNHSLV